MKNTHNSGTPHNGEVLKFLYDILLIPKNRIENPGIFQLKPWCLFPIKQARTIFHNNSSRHFSCQPRANKLFRNFRDILITEGTLYEYMQ